MKMADVKEIATHRGKTELNTSESWLLDKEGKKVRLVTLMSLEDGKAAVVELSEFKTDKKKANGLDDTLDHVFVLGKIPLKASAKADNSIVIRKLEKFSEDDYNERTKKMASAHADFLREKLDEVLK